MYAIRNILVLYHRNPGDEAALDRAVSLAQKVGGSVIVCEALDPASAGPLSWFLPPSPRARRAWDRLVVEREAHFRRLLSGIDRLNIPVQSRVLAEGPAYEGVVRAVIEEDIDLVVVAGADAALAGTGPQRDLVARLMRGCPCPVWVVNSDCADGFDRLAAAVSLPEDPVDDHDSPRRVLDLVGALNAAEQCRVDIIHAWDFAGNDHVRAHSEISRDVLRDMERKAETARRARIRQLIAATSLDQEQVEIHTLRGAPGSVIPQFVERHGIGLVVMGSQQHSPLKGLLAGKVAQKVASGLECSVLAVNKGLSAAAFRPHPLA